MNPKLKGYLLTYLGWMLGTSLACVAAYGASSDAFQKFTEGEKFESTTEAFVIGGFGSIIAVAAAIAVYQVVVLIASPLITYLLLFHTRDKVIKTVAFQFGLLFISPMFIIVSMLTDASSVLAVYLTLFWLVLIPFLSRYLAIHPAKNK